MAIQAAAVEVLMEKGRFESSVAVAIAEAVDMTIAAYQIVTVPVLDLRLGELRAEFKVEMARLRAEFKEDMARLRAEFKEDIASLRAELSGEIAQSRAELVRWVFLVMLGNVALTAGVTALLNFVQRM